MLAKVGLADIDADSTYMNDATGPKRGARLLFDGQIDSRTNARTLSLSSAPPVLAGAIMSAKQRRPRK
jgi:hypothetical protein